MKAKDLIKILSEGEDFDVEVLIVSQRYAGARPDYDHYNVVGVADIGYSSKRIVLDVDYKGE